MFALISQRFADERRNFHSNMYSRQVLANHDTALNTSLNQ